MKKIAILLVGKRKPFEHGYWRKVNRVERRLKELAVNAVLILVALVISLLLIDAWLDGPSGRYVPDGYDANGKLIDTDGDGDFYHWEEY